MTTIELSIIASICAFFTLITMFSHRDEKLREDTYNAMKVDHLQTCNAMLFCTRNDAERLIDAFYGRWSGIIDEWELSTRTAALYKRVMEAQKVKRDMHKDQ
jgi:hypothetical protein